MFKRNKKKIFQEKKYFSKTLGAVIQIYTTCKNFLIKELSLNQKELLSLQKHFHRSEHWVVTQGIPKITLNKKFLKKTL